MLDTLYIKNFAIIDELEISFGSGLNVISGETGAGKSIVIGSINFVLGGKADRGIIKTGKDIAEVSMIISVDDEHTVDRLSEIDVEADEDNYIVLKRTLNSSGKSNCRINGRTVTVSIVRQVAALLFDIHSQHDNHKLLNSKNHISILDNLCPEPFDSKIKELAAEYNKYKSLIKDIKSIDTDSKDIQDRIDLYSYQIDEISQAKLKVGEDDELDNRRAVLVNSVRLKTCANDILDSLYRSESSAAIDSISSAMDNLSVIENIDSSVSEISDELNNAYNIIEDVVSSVRTYADNIDCNTDELDEIENRITLIYNLKKKYGSTIDIILKYLADTQSKLDKIQNSEKILEGYKKDLKILEGKIRDISLDISNIRAATAKYIGDRIQNNLYDLSMESAEFEISVKNTDIISPKGSDEVEFLISPNKGEPLKPLSKVASGGEMSRVMLALKTVLADSDSIDTFIFDEIDTGISGRTAQKVAEKLILISKNHQIICITHLPQIAAMADNNYLIEKSSDDKSTSTAITELQGDDIYNEIARLIGGTAITSSTILAAKEMKELADQQKER